MTRKPIDNADIFAGEQLRAIRIVRGMKQEDIADAMGVSFQQVQKYETGKNKLSVGHIVILCDILNISHDYFFQNKKKITIPDVDGNSGDLIRKFNVLTNNQKRIVRMVMNEFGGKNDY